MLSPDRPTDIDSQPTGLDYWIGRATDRSENDAYHVTYKGCALVLHPKRAVLAKFDGRQVLVEDAAKYQGRGWLEKLTADTEAAIETLKGGGGDVPKRSLGDDLRDELARRKAGQRRHPVEREHWYEWLEDDELPILFGAWLHRASIVYGRHDINRRPVVDFHITNEEFEHSTKAMSPTVMFITFQRLAQARRGVPTT